MAWVPLQFLTLFGIDLVRVCRLPNTSVAVREKSVLFFGVGRDYGDRSGINYSHELMHQKDKVERWMGGRACLAMVLYSHFRSEHLLGAPPLRRHAAEDPCDRAHGTRAFTGITPACCGSALQSAWNAEKGMLARKRSAEWSDTVQPVLQIRGAARRL